MRTSQCRGHGYPPNRRLKLNPLTSTAPPNATPTGQRTRRP
uniref:Uncharacterized protein n=1 Tax=Arundo donax TaxID=35708 RepID=A0A0A9G7V5_ARUDO